MFEAPGEAAQEYARMAMAWSSTGGASYQLEGEWKRSPPRMQTLPVCARDASFTDSKEVCVTHRLGAEGYEIGRPRDPPQDVVCKHVSTQRFDSMAKRKVLTHRTVRQDWRAGQKTLLTYLNSTSSTPDHLDAVERLNLRSRREPRVW